MERALARALPTRSTRWIDSAGAFYSAGGGRLICQSPYAMNRHPIAQSPFSEWGLRTVNSGMTDPVLCSKNSIIEDSGLSSNVAHTKIFKHSINSPESCKF